jgi:uncharacterized protein YidB (DUF937 family)
MGFLGGLLSNVMGGNASPEHSNVAQVLLQHLGDNQGSGGLQDILNKFQNAGLGEQANSWVSTGANQPINPDQVEQGMGSGLLNQLAAKAGVSPTVAKIALAAALPFIVSHLTPKGQVPDQGSIAQKIKGMLGNAA